MAYRNSDYDPTDPMNSRQALLDGMGTDPGTGDVQAPTQVQTNYPTDPGLPPPAPTAPAPSAAPAPTPSSGMPAYDPNNPSTWVEPTQPGGTGAAAANANPTAYGLAPSAAGAGVTDQHSALQAAFAQGLTGQAAVDWVQQNYPQYNQYGTGIEWQPSTGTYGVPGGYFAQNPQTGTWGFVARTEGGGGAAPTASGGTADNPFGVVPSLSPTDTPFNQQMRSFLTSELGNYATPMTADSPELQPAIGAFDTQSQRDEQAARDQIAEQFYAESPGGVGVDSGGINTAIAQNREAAAGNRANFAGNAVMNANSQRRQELVTMLSAAEQYGLTDQAQQIQQKIAQLDAQLQEQGLQQNFATSNNTLGLDYAGLLAQQNRDALLYGMTG